MRTRGKQLPKYFLGGALTLASTGLSVFGQLKARKEQEEAEEQAQAANLNRTRAQDRFELDDFESNGYNIEGFYELGGGLEGPTYKARGGKLKRLSSDTEIVDGRTHDQGGVDLYGRDGKAFAEVEDEEVIKDGNRVYSDKLEFKPGVTYAAQAESYAKEKAQVEEALMSGDSVSRATARRKIQVLDSKEDQLFNMQESTKMKYGGSMKYEDGGKFVNTLEAGLPYLDNLVNAGLTIATPKVASPTYVKPRKRKTTVNVSDQINEVNRGVDAASKVILENTSNSAAARAGIATAKLQGASQKAKIRANKENVETQLTNQVASEQERIAALNADKTDRFNALQTARAGEVQSRISANVSNLIDDYIEKRNFDEATRYNNEMLAAIKARYERDGIVTRSDEAFLRQLKILQDKD